MTERVRSLRLMRPVRGLLPLALAVFVGCDESPTNTGWDIPDCDMCGRVIVTVATLPHDESATPYIFVVARGTDPDLPSVLGSKSAREPGEFRLSVGTPWGSQHRPSFLDAWIVVDWHDEPTNDARVDIDSILVRVHLRPFGQSPPEQRARVTLRR